MNKKKQPTVALLDPEHAEFIQRRVSISVGTRDDANVPALTRAFGCSVAADRSRVTIYVSVPRSAAVLDNVRANGTVAVVFTRPSTHQTLQLKGIDAEVVTLKTRERANITAYRESFVEDLAAIGYSHDYARGLSQGAEEEIVGVRFTPSAAFVQTPGPDAGRQLRSGA